MNYEFRTPMLGILGLVIYVLWNIEFFKLLKTPQLFLPVKILNIEKKGLNFNRIAAYLIGFLAWILLTIALMGPRKAKSFTESNIKVNDIFFVMDVSRSMLAEDFAPNRLEVSKQKVFEFIQLRPTDRIGIIMFAREVFTLLPLTTDLKLIEQTIDSINVGRLGSATNIGDALGLAVARSIRSEAKKKVIILMTDGVSNAGNIEPMDAAQQAADSDIKVYTIGIGAEKGARLPIGNGAFGKRYQNLPGGSIDKKLLQEIAKVTKAKAFMAGNENALKDVLDEINNLEKTDVKISGQIVYQEKFYLFLVFGVILLLISDLMRRFILREMG